MRKRGFATLSPAQRIAVARKGGKAKVKKGFATMTPEKRSENGRKGGIARRVNKEKEDYGEDFISDRDESSYTE